MMYQRTFTTLICAISFCLIFTIFSCDKDKSTLDQETVVYTVGHDYNGDSYIIRLWRNSTPQNITDGWHSAEACDVHVSGEDVYIAGLENDNPNSTDNYKAVLWKNGVPQTLGGETGKSIARSVFVSGKDVYVAGYEENEAGDRVAILWKNGTPQELGIGNATSVFVADGNVYVAGIHEGNAVVWKNGNILPQSDGLNTASALSVYVSNGDVYAAGYEYKNGNKVARLWKNGIEQELNDNFEFAEATSVFVHEGDVYVTTNNEIKIEETATSDWYLLDEVKLWKNGTPQLLAEDSDEIQFAEANSVYVFEGETYVAGKIRKNGNSTPILWKNGEPQGLGAGSHATSVYVRKE